jgi:hypothetical protein
LHENILCWWAQCEEGWGGLILWRTTSITKAKGIFDHSTKFLLQEDEAYSIYLECATCWVHRKLHYTWSLCVKSFVEKDCKILSMNCRHTNIVYRACTSKWDRQRRPKEEEKKESKQMIENTSHMCRNKTQWNTVKTVKQYRIGRKGWGSAVT